MPTAQPAPFHEQYALLDASFPLESKCVYVSFLSGSSLHSTPRQFSSITAVFLDSMPTDESGQRTSSLLRKWKQTVQCCLHSALAAIFATEHRHFTTSFICVAVSSWALYLANYKEMSGMCVLHVSYTQKLPVSSTFAKYTLRLRGVILCLKTKLKSKQKIYKGHND